MILGSNLNVTFRRGRLELLGGGGAFNFASDAGNLPGALSVRSFGWSGRTNATWKFNRNASAQVFAHYVAPMAIEGGRQSAYVMMNFAVQRKLWGDQGSITVRVSDPFNVSAIGVRMNSDQVRLITRQTLGTRGLAFVLSRSFGQQLKLKPRQIDDATPMSRPIEP